ncbi:acid phosphatase/Vanadium-dependent haloperoxidase [Cystobasidium minutum MCA 4210]|uniref:acid phosphatase/Vanadium-dependent haloperoxidase n=1 Tax=Cystobasidium minutum MCA 4210 TaxID=1397322 RepID=UPI0034CD80F7|eukprot:jgi/Rhomi1/163171/estExt_Genewise1Plus.C_7_t10206
MFWPNYLYPSPDRRKVTPERRRRLLFSYAPDWIITVGLWIGVYFIDRIHGFRREFSLTDTSLQHTYTVHERVPVWSLGLICLAPLIFYIFIGLYIMRSVWDLHAAVLGEVLSLALTISITTVIKVLVGRPRPDIIARCRPESGAENGVPYGLVTSAICTTTNLGRLQEGFRSFPSGHASTAFAGLGFFAFYIAGKMHLFDQRGHTIKAWITVIPFTGAALIALTRVTDYRHHATDIIAGSLLGLGLSYFSYRLYYPPLHHPMAHKAYSPRIPADEDMKDTLGEDDDVEEAYPEERRASPNDARRYNVRHNDSSDEYAEGPEGTLKRPAGGVGQGPPIPLRASSSMRTGSPANSRSTGYYQSERMV